MKWLGGKIASFVWWTYPRGSFEYDIMVALILAFVFLAPRAFFRDQPRPIPAAADTFAALAPAPDPFALAAQTPPALPAVLAAIDKAAPKLQSLSAAVEYDYYTALVQDLDKKSGTFAFKRSKSGPMMVLNLTQPAAAAERFIYKDQTGYLYTPASKQENVTSLGSRQDLLNQFLLLGFGSTGDDLARAYRVVEDGPVQLDGVATVKLSLTPLHPDLAASISSVDLWYDTRHWIAVQQQIWEKGDYRLAHYTDVQINPPLDDAVFTTKFPGMTVVTSK